MRSALALCVLFWASPVAAEDAPATEETPTKTKFYDFGELSLTGDKVKPQVEWISARQRALFERLFALRRSFLPELQRGARPAETPPVREATK